MFTHQENGAKDPEMLPFEKNKFPVQQLFFSSNDFVSRAGKPRLTNGQICINNLGDKLTGAATFDLVTPWRTFKEFPEAVPLH